MAKQYYNPCAWEPLVPNIRDIVSNLEAKHFLSVGVTPYTRIVPSLFLKNYSLYGVANSSDAQIIKQQVGSLYTLEDVDPALAGRTRGTGFLIGTKPFQKFVRSRKQKPTLLFDITTEKIIRDVEALGVTLLGNHPSTYEGVYCKGDFRALLNAQQLPAVPSQIIPRTAFIVATYTVLVAEQGGAFVVQRADKETGVSGKTFFVKSESDFKRVVGVFIEDTSFNDVLISPFIEGHSVSMLGCVLRHGTLSGPLQLQLIDIPESLHGVPADGVFFGNDLSFTDWDVSIEQEAQRVVEAVGDHLRQAGYKGIFGIDFLYDVHRKQIFATECNPRGTGSLQIYSFAMLEQQTPPLDFFHLVSHTGLDEGLDIELINRALKTRRAVSHAAISPSGIPTMNLKIAAGVYSFNFDEKKLEYKRPGLCFADVHDSNEFIIADTVPVYGAKNQENVPRLWKFIFPYSIATSSFGIEPRAAYLLETFSKALLKAAQQGGL